MNISLGENKFLKNKVAKLKYLIKNNPTGNTISQKMILFQKITIKNLVSLELR